MNNNKSSVLVGTSLSDSAVRDLGLFSVNFPENFLSVLHAFRDELPRFFGSLLCLANGKGNAYQEKGDAIFRRSGSFGSENFFVSLIQRYAALERRSQKRMPALGIMGFHLSFPRS